MITAGEVDDESSEAGEWYEGAAILVAVVVVVFCHRLQRLEEGKAIPGTAGKTGEGAEIEHPPPRGNHSDSCAGYCRW